LPEIEVGPIVQAERARRRSYALRKPDAWLRWHAEGLLGIRVFLEPAGAFDDRERATALREVDAAASAADGLAELEQTLTDLLGHLVRPTAWRPEVDDPIEMRATLVLRRTAFPVERPSGPRPAIAVPVERGGRSRTTVGGSAKDGGTGLFRG
jgi:hypothetical protein